MGLVDSRFTFCPIYCSAASGQGLDLSLFILGFVPCKVDAG